jgi:hypothetical protein
MRGIGDPTIIKFSENEVETFKHHLAIRANNDCL